MTPVRVVAPSGEKRRAFNGIIPCTTPTVAILSNGNQMPVVAWVWVDGGGVGFSDTITGLVLNAGQLVLALDLDGFARYR